jgi:trimeric autotransporter adhesin
MKVRILRVMVAWLSLVLSLTPFIAQTSAQTASALPRLVRFGGTVKALNGSPLTGVVGVTFAFYSEQNGGAALWLETQNVTADSNGRYTALLGSMVPEGLPADLFTSEQARWVGVQVSGQAEQPRVLLVSAPYALKAGDAETIGGLPPSAFVLANSFQGAASGVKTASAPASAGAQKNTAPPANPAVTGKGVVDFISMWDSASDIVDSVIFQKAAEIGIGTITPAATLDVNGKTAVRDSLMLFPKGTDPTLAISGTPFKIDQTGKMTFIAGQTFPGTGTITGIMTPAGSGLAGGGATGTLSLKVPAAGITNAMLADSKIALNSNSAGGLTAPGAMSLGVSTRSG